MCSATWSAQKPKRSAHPLAKQLSSLWLAPYHQALHYTGHGRALAWLLLELAEKPHDALPLSTMIDAAHALRTVNAQRDGRPAPCRQDTAFSVLLTTFTLFAESFADDIAYESAGIGGQGAKFRRRLSGLLEAQLDR